MPRSLPSTSFDPQGAPAPTFARRLHKASGQAVVTFDQHDYCLGKFRSIERRKEYDRLIGLCLANGRRLPASAATACDLTVVELMALCTRLVDMY